MHFCAIRRILREKAVPFEGQLSRRSLLKFAVWTPVVSLASGCAGLERGAPFPPELADQITVLGLTNARFWPDTQLTAMVREATETLARERAAQGYTSNEPLPPVSFLAVSGGGDDGAFGAGLLCGW